MNNHAQSIELLKTLIRFGSVSSSSNVAITDFVSQTLQHLGFSCHHCDYIDHAGVAKANLIASRGIGDGGVVYCCHTDVVPADQWSGPGCPFDPVVENDRIYGRGSCDMKGSLVAMIAAIGQIDAQTQTAPIHVICTADEERAFVGAKQLVANSPVFRALVASQPLAIIGEPTRGEIIHAHKGIVSFRITSRGRAAHSSTRDGVNANIAMVPMIAELLRLCELTETDQRYWDTRFDPPTLTWNFGFSDRCDTTNIVPERCEAWVLFRPMPTVDGSDLISAAADKAASLGLAFRIEEGGGHVWIDPDDPAILEMCEIAGQSRAKTVCYGTDGGEFTELKRMVVCGPGDIAQAHTSDEYLAIDGLSAGIDLYARVLQRYTC